MSKLTVLILSPEDVVGRGWCGADNQALRERAAKGDVQLFVRLADVEAALSASKQSSVAVPLLPTGPMTPELIAEARRICEASGLRLAEPPAADAQDAARYRWLRDGNAVRPEEACIYGGTELDQLCDRGIQSSPNRAAEPT